MRQFASLDHISNGRIGWNIVTSWSVAAAHNYGDDIQVSHAERYARAEEYMAVAKALWDSWADDAVLDDRPAGRYAKRGSIHALDHAGEHYKVAGPLNVPRCPQGRPVFVQAGSSETGRDFAARHAEVVFTAQMEKATAQAFYADLKARAAGAGRDPDRVAILPGFSPLIADTQEEAERLVLELNGLADPEVGRKRLSGRFGGFDFGHLDLDRALTAADFPDPDTVQAARSRAATIVGLVERERPTLRQLLAKLAGARGHYTFAGTPEQTADFMEEWLADGAADGLQPDAAGAALDAGCVHRAGPADPAGEGPVPRGLFRRHAPLALTASPGRRPKSRRVPDRSSVDFFPRSRPAPCPSRSTRSIGMSATPVTFYSEGFKLMGDLYRPDGLGAGERRAGIVLCHGYTGVKDLYLPDNARVLTEAGYVVLAFDYKGWGEREGPRTRLAPYSRVADVQAALTFLGAQEEVDETRLGISTARAMAGPRWCGRARWTGGCSAW